jgi:hypothetical protein
LRHPKIGVFCETTIYPNGRVVPGHFCIRADELREYQNLLNPWPFQFWISFDSLEFSLGCIKNVLVV